MQNSARPTAVKFPLVTSRDTLQIKQLAGFVRITASSVSCTPCPNKRQILASHSSQQSPWRMTMSSRSLMLKPEISSQDGKRKMRIRPKQSCGRLTGTIPASVITLQSSSEQSCKDIQRSKAYMRGPSRARSDVPPALHSQHNVLGSLLGLTVTVPHEQLIAHLHCCSAYILAS